MVTISHPHNEARSHQYHIMIIRGYSAIVISKRPKTKNYEKSNKGENFFNQGLCGIKWGHIYYILQKMAVLFVEFKRKFGDRLGQRDGFIR